ncbi:sugar ABC transporter permease [Sinomonas cyclohexanicum]|uniref:Sugar ABC transporter permease n=1 Tax=Sinomonas cyclohexanicum TaxID=322009 RepID=A0ABN6FN38_SINCY|nr:ABC transporter permease [Corynebacterium cyclohexanicum]BCT78080.1 sugar ABC transporter permease [Corynebacterium cyclohexanicum]
MAEASVSRRRNPFEGLTIGAVLLEARAFLALVVIFVVFSFLAPSAFPTLSNIIVMCQQVSVYAILAVGMLIVILDGGIDLSVGSTLGLSGMVAGLALQGFPIAGVVLYPPVWVVVIVAVITGALIGLINGVLVARLNVAPFVATLGTMYVMRGLASLTTNGLTVNNLGGREDLGNTGFEWLGFNALLGIPVGIWILVVVAIIASLLLNRSVYGRWLYAAGGNARAAELSGVPVRKVRVRAYVISGVCAAIAGVILTSELTSAGPTQGTSYELTAIAAVVIGGAALSGGKGTVRGTLLGAFVIGFLAAGLTIVGISAYVQTVFTGAVIVLAVLLNGIQVRRRRRAKESAGSPPSGPAQHQTAPGSQNGTEVPPAVKNKTV